MIQHVSFLIMNNFWMNAAAKYINIPLQIKSKKADIFIFFKTQTLIKYTIIQPIADSVDTDMIELIKARRVKDWFIGSGSKPQEFLQSISGWLLLDWCWVISSHDDHRPSVTAWTTACAWSPEAEKHITVQKTDIKYHNNTSNYCTSASRETVKSVF